MLDQLLNFYSERIIIHRNDLITSRVSIIYNKYISLENWSKCRNILSYKKEFMNLESWGTGNRNMSRERTKLYQFLVCNGGCKSWWNYLFKIIFSLRNCSWHSLRTWRGPCRGGKQEVRVQPVVCMRGSTPANNTFAASRPLIWLAPNLALCEDLGDVAVYSCSVVP